MALPLTTDSLDSLDESVRNLYVEEDGKFRLDIDGYEDPAGLKNALKSEREAAKDAKQKLTAAKEFQAQFEGLDIEAVKGLLAKASQDEETRLIAEGKIDEVFNRRTERFRSDVDKQLKAKDDEIGRHVEANKKLAGRALSDAVLQAASKAGALPEAMEDIVQRARAAGWTVNEDGDVVAMDGDEPVLGKDGKTPLTPSEWAESLRESAPHLWPRAQGAGQTGDRGAKGTKKRSDMTPEEMAAYIKEHGREAYLKLPK